MGVQLIPALEGYDKDYFLLKRAGGDWKSARHHLEKLDTFAKQLEVETLIIRESDLPG